MKTPLSLSSAHVRPAAPIWVAAVAMINAEGRVLMQQRPVHGAHGGLWEFPGGKLEPGEAPHHAAVRELAEELRVTIDAAALTPVSFASTATPPARESDSVPLTILLFACRQWQGEPAALAAAQLGWYAPSDLSQLAMPPLDYPLAAALRVFLQAEVH